MSKCTSGEINEYIEAAKKLMDIEKDEIESTVVDTGDKDGVEITRNMFSNSKRITLYGRDDGEVLPSSYSLNDATILGSRCF